MLLDKSLSYKVNFFDFRGKSDSKKNMSPERFSATTYSTKLDGVAKAQKQAKENFFHEKYKKKEEMESQVLR